MNLKAVIFDLDGTVILDEDIYTEAFRDVLAKYGIKEKRKKFHKGGIGVKENWDVFIKRYDLKTNKNSHELTKETLNVFIKHIDEVKVNPGFEGFVDELKNSGILTALATSSEREIVDELFSVFQIGKYFDNITTGDEVENKKPDPEIFIISSQKLGVNPSECVVFEDSSAGIDAAYSAGMNSVLVKNGSNDETNTKASLIIKTFNDISVDQLINLDKR
jgi:HAD superfamily hydrolase (TIGR01509 family)